MIGLNASDIQVDRRLRAGASVGSRVAVGPPGEVCADYVDEVDELVMVVEGNIEFEIDGKAYRSSPGEEILILAHARHIVPEPGRGESRWLCGYRR